MNRPVRPKGRDVDLEAEFQRARPIPNPDAKRQRISAEDFAAWCAHPVTRYIAAAYARAAADQRRAWDLGAWDGGPRKDSVDGARLLELGLVELRTRADAYSAFTDTAWADWVTLIESD